MKGASQKKRGPNRWLPLIVLLAVLWSAPDAFAQGDPDLAAFQTAATITYNDDQLMLVSAMASIEPATTQGEYWLSLNFYSFTPMADDLPGIELGNVRSMDDRLAVLPIDDFNHGHALLKLTLDKDFKVTQVDASMPGHACTLSDEATQAFASNTWLTGNQFRVKVSGSYSCQPPDPADPEIFGVSLDFESQVFRVRK